MKNTVLSAVAATVLPFSLHPTAYAAEPTKLEEIVVISSRLEMPLRQVGSSVSVMNAADIEARGFNSLADLLRTLPAVAAGGNGGIGKPTSLRIRGEEGFRTLVLIDGMNVSDPTGPQVSPQIQHILSSGIARVEVLRGAQGMMYGADAGGVISITTPRGEPGLASNLDIEAGRYGSRRLAGNLSGGSDAVDFFIAATDFNLDGFNIRDTDTELRDEDGYENTTLHGRLGWQASERLRFEGIARDVSGDNEYDGCFTADFTATDTCSDDFDQLSMRIAGQYAGEVFNHQLSVENTDVETAFFSNGTPTFGSEGDIRRIEYLGNAGLSDDNMLVYGIEHKQERIETDGDSDRDRDQLGYYLEYQSAYLDQLFFTLGVRHDDNDDFGEHTSYRATTAYLTPLSGGATLKWKASYGTGFRAPSLSEVALNANSRNDAIRAVVLEEETSKGFDLGVEYFGSDGLHLEAVYFDQQVEDEIFYDPITGAGYLQASGTGESTGVELSAQIPVADYWTLSTNYTYNDTETTSGDLRTRRPRHLANLGASYDRGNWGLGVNLRASRDAVDAGTDLDDYDVFDISARYRFSEAVEVYGRIENALDEDYQEVRTYNTAAAAGFIGLRLTY